jgi:peroxiredoxin
MRTRCERWSPGSAAQEFQLTDQHGQAVSLASLRGKVVLLTFLDPVCTTDSPLIAQEFRAAGQLLGASSKVELVAIVASPVYHQVAYTRAFDRQEHLLATHPGPGTTATKSSFAVLFADAARQVMGQS